MHRFPVLIFILLLCSSLAAQTTDTILPPTDSSISPSRIDPPVPTTARVDSFSKRPVPDRSWSMQHSPPFTLQQMSSEVLAHHPWMGFSSVPFYMRTEFKKFRGKEIMFYALVALLLMYALLKNAFPKYFSDLFRLFFRTTIKQRQIRDQLMQTPLPSLLLNAFFIITAGIYASMVLRHYKIDPFGNFWLTSLYCSLALGVAYFVKFMGLKLSGWLFNMKEAADSYIFIVFIVNKMIGILLLPFLLVLAFTTGNIYQLGLTLSYCLIAGLILYRFILTFGAVRNQVKVNPFHFFLYLVAFEVAPLLLIYKALLRYVSQTT